MKNNCRKYSTLPVFPFLVFTALVLLSSVPAISDNVSVEISENSFCMHVHSHKDYEKAFSTVPYSLLRTWDSSIGWPLIEPENGKWNWELLDNYVRLAREKNIRLIMTLGMTPRWAAKNPDAPSPYGSACSSSPPANIADWEEFIRKVSERNETLYGGAIRFWEIWNEPDNAVEGYSFYTGTVEELIEMARSAHSILKAANPENMIVSPGITQVGQNWLDKFLAGGGKNFIDIVGYHFYWVWYPPSITDFEPSITSLKKVMKKNGVDGKLLWMTETGFDVSRFNTQGKKNIALAMTLIAPRYYGADVVCAYSLNNNVFTHLYDTEQQKPTETAAAYIQLHKWLTGASISGLSSGNSGAKILTLKKKAGTAARIVWRYGEGKIKFHVNDSYGSRFYKMDGTDNPIPENRIIELGNNPILIAGADYFLGD